MARKSEDNLKDKIKNLLGISKNQSPSSTPKSHIKEITITREVLREIGPDSPANNRIKRIQELSDIVTQKRLEENAVEALLNATRDLLQPQVNVENRQTALHFIQCILEGQLNNLGILRGHFFHIIENLSSKNDLRLRFELFRILSENGKNLHDFEDETGEFLLRWMPDVLSIGKISEYLSLLVNVIKFNAAYLDEDIVSSLVQQTCMIPNRTRSEEDMKLCMEVLDAVVCYSYLPSSSLYHFIAALCHLVNIARVCKESWDLMRKLLGTHLGHSSIYTMCCMLQDRREPVDAILLRGAVFFIGMALWGSNRVQSLKQTSTSVLPSFLQALRTRQPIVGHEVILSIQRLVKKYGKDLQSLSWDIILNIIETLIEQYEDIPSSPANDESKIQVEIHDVLTTIESLHENRQYLGSVARFFTIIEMCANRRRTQSVSLLIDYHAQSITPVKEKWMENLNSLLDRFFRQEKRTDVRKKALDILSFVLGINKHIYEVELIQKVVLPNLGNIDSDPDPEVRQVAADILLVLAQSCNSNEFFEIMAIIEKILKKALVILPAITSEEIVQIVDEKNLSDVKATALKLVEVFKHKLYQFPSTHSVKISNILIEYIDCQYKNTVINFTACSIRQSIMECLLQLRSDSLHRLGMADRPSDVQYPFSPYVHCYSSETPVEPVTSPGIVGSNFQLPTTVTSVIDYTDIFKLFITCLKKELDWEVLKCVLTNLPLVLQNKTLILSTHGDLIDELCHQLTSMVNDRSLSLPEKLKNLQTGFTRADFHTFVFPVLAAMVTYHDCLERIRQTELIKCLEFGFVSKCAKGCVSSLRICTLEMQEVMMRLLPLVLLSLSKISATISMAIPVLAFLSSIVRLPKLYTNFVEDQYMSVFAIALPYTNPFKFSHYTVSLAHHVIAVWFIRCRLPFRKGFVKFIHTGLKANVLQQFEENSKLHLKNQDSSDRCRSGSYTSGTRVRRRMASGSSILKGDQQAPIEEKMSQFHKELTETCTDMMARYTFGNVSTTPQRSPVAQFLLKGGASQTWLVGNKIVTITTSGGNSQTSNNGLCEKCLVLYQESQETRQKATKKSRDRRRHKSTACLSRSHSQVDPVTGHPSEEGDSGPRWSQDDLSLITDDPFSVVDRDDVGVQTGSSLLGSLEKDPIESLLLGNKSLMPEKRAFSMNQCNCWCTGWAEILIRGPSGNMSWMMRIENETNVSSQTDLAFSDLTLLFAPTVRNIRHQRSHDSDNTQKIDSESLGEDEYESIYSKHFPSEQSKEDPASISAEPSKETKGFVIPDKDTEKDVSPSSSKTSFPSPASLRKINSSPSIINSYTEESPTRSSPDVAVPDTETLGDTPSKTQTTVQPLDIIPPEIQDTVQSKVPTIKAVKPNRPVKRNLSNSLLQETIEEATTETSNNEDENLEDEKEGNSVFPEDVSTNSHQADQPMLQFDGDKLAPLAVSSDQKFPSDASQTESTLSHTSSTNSTSPDDMPEMKTIKPRGHTISVMSPATEVRQKEDVDNRSKSGSVKEGNRSGISPGFVFLQLFHNHPLISSQETPILLPQTEATERALRLLNHIHPYETHKLGVVYVGPGQANNEKAILSNVYGSERYARLVERLGQLICLRDVNPDQIYTGGLAQSGEDGQFAYSWQDDAMQVIFHIATLMPNKESDPNCNSKKRHIGNDYVTIIYNDSQEDYKIGTIKGSFNYVNIVIKPLDYESNAVTLQTKEDIAEILGHTDTKIISDENLAQLVRQIAMHCNLASMVLQRQQSQPQDPFASNWLERLRQIKRIKQKALQLEMESIKEGGVASPAGRSFMEDFTDYV